MAKYDAAGRRIWVRQPGTDQFYTARGVTTDAAGNMYLAGRTGGTLGGANQGGDDAWLMKFAQRP